MRNPPNLWVQPWISAAADPQARMADSEMLSGALSLERDGAVHIAPASADGLRHASSPLFSTLALFFHSGHSHAAPYKAAGPTAAC